METTDFHDALKLLRRYENVSKELKVMVFEDLYPMLKKLKKKLQNQKNYLKL